MSVVDELHQKLCPDGVEYRKLGDICSIEKGKTPIQKAVPGEYPLVVTADDRLSCNTYQFEGNAVCIPLISSSGHGKKDLRTIHYQTGKFALGNILCAVIPNDETRINARFLYIYLLAKKDILIVPLMRGGANVSLTTASMKNIKVPIPPLEIQQEIVRILDQFTELTAELTAELTVRKKQYEYYREKLLHEYGTETKLLGELCKTITTGKLNANAMVEDGEYPFFTCDAKPYRIDQYAFDTEAILVSGNGSQVGHINYYSGKFNAYQRTYVLAGFQGVDTKYLLFYLKAYLREYIMIHSKKGSVPYITLPMLQNFKVVIPSCSEQHRIVSILDRFDALCNYITSGLPAEIEARRKQYEYYRDKLLTFKEKEKREGI